ncbi:MAG: hypothetical protein ACKVU4_13835 [Phycisphaerales bacterium]
MTRPLRRGHLRVWFVLGPAAVLILVAALASRRPTPIQPPPVTSSPVEPAP